LNSIPASKVILDGRPLGDTPKVGVSVSPGSHTVLFVRDGERQAKSVTVGPGEKKTVVHRFK
jgi:serine/threonine-protein kinase